MGDRANIVIKSDGEQVCLYTHWEGTELPETLRTALTCAQTRWNDFQYLTRIIFCTMVRDRWQETTGFGITQNIHDNEHPIIVVDVDAQTVAIGDSVPQSFSDYITKQ